MANIPIDLSLRIPRPHFKTILELIKLSFGLFFKSFGFIAVVVLLVNLPLELISEFALPPDLHHLTIHFIFDLFSGFLRLFVTLALLYGFACFLQKKGSPSPKDALIFSFRKWIPAFIANFRAAFYVALLVIPAGLIIFFLVDLFHLPVWLLYFFFVLFIPGFIVGLALIFTKLAVCFESQTRMDPLTRSRELTLGHRWMIFFVFLVLSVPSYFPLLMDQLARLGWVPFPGNPWLTHGLDILVACVVQLLSPIRLISCLLIYLKALKEKKKRVKELRLLFFVP